MTPTKRWTLIVVCTATAMLMLDIAVVNTALSRIAGDLHAGLGGLQWVVDAYTLALASVVLTAGSLADRFGRRRLFTAGLSLFTLSSIGCAAASSITFLDGARAVQGIGAAVMFAVSLAILADAFPDGGERAGALAAYGATIGGSFALGPLVGGLLTSGLGWQWIFLVNVPIGAFCLWGTRAKVRESRDPHPPRVDVPGQLLLAPALFLLVLGLLRGNEDGWGSAAIVAELAGGGGLLLAFVAVEALVAHPMLPLSLFRNRRFTGSQIAQFAISASLFASYLYATLYLQQVLGLSAIEAGLVYLPATIVNFITAALTGVLAARGVSQRAMVAGGLVLVAAGMAMVNVAGVHSSWFAVVPGMVVAMAGTGLLNPTAVAVALGSVPPQQSGLAAGAMDTFRQAGVAIGVAGLGALIPTSSGLGAADPGAFVSGLHTAMFAGAGLAAAGAIAAAWLLRPARDAAAQEVMQASAAPA